MPIKDKIKDLLRHAYYPVDERLSRLFGKRTFSQMGEDLIVWNVLHSLLKPAEKCTQTYIDVGANDAYALSNTALMYMHGWSGLLVEPNPVLAKRLEQARPRDRVLQAGVGSKRNLAADFHVFKDDVLSTFSPGESSRYREMGHMLDKVISIPIITLDQVFEELPAPDFLNLDIEGLDVEVVESADWRRYRPAVICVETGVYSMPPRRDPTVARLLERRGYFLYADTFNNSILLDTNKFEVGFSET